MAGQNILNAASISPQVILSQQLAATEATLYTVPASTSVKVAHGTICNITGTALPPTLTLGTTSTSGGALAAATYYWVVSAKSSAGETIASNEVTATTTGSTSSQPLSWTVTPGATSYNVYRGSAGAGLENILVANVTGTSYTDTGASASTKSPVLTSAFGFPTPIFLSIVKTGGTVGDGTHRVINNYSLAANETLSLNDYIGSAMLGPGDIIAGYAGSASAVDLVITGTVHA